MKLGPVLKLWLKHYLRNVLIRNFAAITVRYYFIRHREEIYLMYGQLNHRARLNQDDRLN